ncbi:hypothetical protein UCRNP2_6562 [Neofusicoccum parvum UCRNP2]|uniref:Uncharacterized protein n=1 Tax=Botryosphaeria parva (strain UCR-NP2) TaxID=1287680 RepID=R1G5H9_BOTPV|nr:hypothetical protein UCRNP2_6562 [Neofusicoccum parvum UCRNP2]
MEVCGMNISGPHLTFRPNSASPTGFTAEALKHRFRKFKKPVARNGTPRKAAAPEAPKAAKTPKAAARKRKGEDVTSGGDGHDGGEKTARSSPPKRAKVYAEPLPNDEEEPESAPKVKHEENAELE